MGNCLVSQSADPYPSTTTGPPTPGTSSSYSARFSRVVSQDIFSSGERSLVPHLRMYNFLDLKIATGNFKPSAVLGEGDFGSTVFKGWVDEKTLTPCTFGSGMIVAVKKLTPENSLGFQEWVSDVRVLGRLSHPNLVKLLGYCWEDKELLLVYEFVQKGSLADHLFGRSTSREPLSWDIRLKIAIGAARGLAFLHALEKLVIYRDLKPSNILLDGNYNAKLSDNGLAALGHSSGNSCVETPVRGTYGYAAPEYLATGHFYVTSDVYGFGVVLLELLTGQRALDTKRPDGQHNLVDWLKPTLSRRRKLKSIMDSRIKGQYSADAAFQAAQLTLKCLESEPEKRPSMREVEEELEKIESIKGKKLRNQNLKP